MIKIGIVEDEVVIAELIKVSLVDSGYFVLDPAYSYEEAVQLLERDTPDLLILDINLSSSPDGIELAKFINKNYQIPFIFLTAFSDKETIARTKLVNPLAYLVKPFKHEDLFATIEICFDNYNKNRLNGVEKNTGAELKKLVHPNYIFVKSGTSFEKVFIDDIVYLKSEHIYITIVTKAQRYLVRTSMKDFMINLDTNVFIKIHKSYVINVNLIQNVKSSTVRIKDVNLPLSKNYKDEFMKRIGIN